MFIYWVFSPIGLCFVLFQWLRSKKYILFLEKFVLNVCHYCHLVFFFESMSWRKNWETQWMFHPWFRENRNSLHSSKSTRPSLKQQNQQFLELFCSNLAILYELLKWQWINQLFIKTTCVITLACHWSAWKSSNMPTWFFGLCRGTLEWVVFFR